MASAAAAASRKAAPSLVVAASLGAVEALKDQAGLCRWGYALRSIYRRTAALSEEAAGGGCARPAAAEMVRLRKAHHLICWGPS